MNLSAKNLIKVLEKNGYIFKRSKGRHHIYYNSSLNKTLVVPFHENKELPKGTFFAILKQAGLSKESL
ncbi:MAG: type II toxin-antitoxin system HicA family toxin [Cyclobacteriaceae bacterium]|nr:type II toxin-antitoxin system HicA family toxin [Cyclobacteriaceae bacterium]